MNRIRIGVLLTNTGDGILLAGIPLVLAAKLDGITALGLAVGLTWLPVAALSWLGGLAFDTFRSSSVVWFTQICRAATLALAVVSASFELSADALVATLVLAGMIANAGEWIVDNGVELVVARTHSVDDLAGSYGSLKSLELASNRLVGPSIGSVLFVADDRVPLLAAAALFVASATALPSTFASVTKSEQPLRRILRFAETTATLVVILGMSLGAGFTMGVLPRFASDVLAIDDRMYGLLISASAVGGIIGGVLTARLSSLQRAGSRELRYGLALTGAFQVAFGISPNRLLAFTAAVSFGVVAAWMASSVAAVRQGEAPQDVRGIVAGMGRALSAIGIGAGAIAGGSIASEWGLRMPWVVAGIAHLVAILGVAGVERFYPNRSLTKVAN